MSQHGHCPACKTELDGGDIVETFIADGKTPEEARRIAANYGYRPGHTQWGRQIGLYDIGKDRTVAYRCPDCEHEWEAKRCA